MLMVGLKQKSLKNGGKYSLPGPQWMNYGQCHTIISEIDGFSNKMIDYLSFFYFSYAHTYSYLMLRPTYSVIIVRLIAILLDGIQNITEHNRSNNPDDFYFNQISTKIFYYQK